MRAHSRVGVPCRKQGREELPVQSGAARRADRPHDHLTRELVAKAHSVAVIHQEARRDAGLDSSFEVVDRSEQEGRVGSLRQERDRVEHLASRRLEPVRTGEHRVMDRGGLAGS